MFCLLRCPLSLIDLHETSRSLDGKPPIIDTRQPSSHQPGAREGAKSRATSLYASTDCAQSRKKSGTWIARCRFHTLCPAPRLYDFRRRLRAAKLAPTPMSMSDAGSGTPATVFVSTRKSEVSKIEA